MNSFHYHDGFAWHGPYDSEQIAGLVRSRVILNTTFVSMNGQPAVAAQALFPSLFPWSHLAPSEPSSPFVQSPDGSAPNNKKKRNKTKNKQNQQLKTTSLNYVRLLLLGLVALKVGFLLIVVSVILLIVVVGADRNFDIGLLIIAGMIVLLSAAPGAYFCFRGAQCWKLAAQVNKQMKKTRR